ncbi:MAG TPA: phage tail protein, partial [Rhizobiaceae bacterium]|nr:phage tail protein [Rhizobiaceae bacterium]
STWGSVQGGDSLPAVQLYNILRGFYWDDAWFYGLQGVTQAQLPDDHWRAQIVKCRTLVDIPGDAQEQQFRSGGEIRVGVDIGKTIDALLTACHGKLSEAGGVYKVFVGAPGSSVASITDGDILSTSEQTFTPFLGLADTINGISGTYPNPVEMWNAKTAPPIKRTAQIERAGNRELMADVAFDLVPYRHQVQRLMKMALDEAARDRRHNITLGPKYWALEPGDVITWNSSRNGYIDKLFRVDGVADQPNLDIVLDLTEIEPSDYNWNPGTDSQDEEDAPLTYLPPQPQAIVDFDAEPVTITGDNGTRRPGIRLVWDGTDQYGVDAVKWEVRLQTGGTIVNRNRTDDVEAGEIRIGTNLFSNTAYEVRAIFVSNAKKRRFLWSEWLPVTTPNVKFNDLDVLLENWGEDARDILQTALETARDAVTRSEILAASVALNAGEQLQGIAAVSKSTQGLAASFLDLKAFAGPGGSLAEALLAVETSYGDLSAGGLLSFEAASSPIGGADAQVNMLVRAEEGGTTAQAGLSARAHVGGGGAVTSDLLLFADRIFMTNGSATFKPFVITDGTLYGDALKVRTAMIEDAAITSAKINDLAVTNAKIANATIEGGKIANAAITNAKIDDATITGAKLANSTITDAKIQNGTIQNASLANVTIESGKIAASAVTAEDDDTASGSLGSWANNTWTTVASFTLNSLNGHAFKLFYDATISGTISGDSGSNSHSIGIRLTVGGTVIKSNTASRIGNGALSLAIDRAVIVPRSAGNHTVAIQMQQSTIFGLSGSWSAEVFGECNKV